MSMWKNRPGNGLRGVPFPESIPPGLNHSILTGALTADPQEGRSPNGDPVTLLRIEFPVANPECQRTLWTWASFEVEVPGDLQGQRAKELRGGAPVLVAGQLSERWVVEHGRSSRRGIVVATLVKAGSFPEDSS